MKILTLARLTAPKLRDHLLPLVMRDELTTLFIVRENPVPLDNSKVRNITYTLDATRTEPRSNSVKTVWGFLKMAWLAAQTIRREDVDGIYGLYLIPYGLLAWGLAKLFGKKSIISLIGTDLNKDVLEYAYAPILRWFLRHTDIVTVFDEAARQKLLALDFDPSKVFVLPHGIEVERFDRLSGLPQDIDAIFVGYLWALKEVGRLLKAWQLVIRQCPDARLVIVGDGPQREELETLARELGIWEQMTFTGVVDNVPEWLSRAKIFVNLANQEGVPMAMIEAMIAGLVPVVTDVGGVPSVVKHGENGFLIPNPADPALVADHILRLLTDETLYQNLRQNALQIRRNHSYAAVSEWWQPILETLKRS
jgi:glycosyltransferase involved in cell wall biosynthesis